MGACESVLPGTCAGPGMSCCCVRGGVARAGGVALARGGVARTSCRTSALGVLGLLMLGVAGELLCRESVLLASSSAISAVETFKHAISYSQILKT